MSGFTRPAAALAAAGLMVLAGCGEKRETTTGAGAAAPAASGGAAVNVSETEFKLTPSSAKVAKAGAVAVKVTNNGATTHALTVEAPGGEVKTPPIAPGKSATLRANLSKPGTYKWYCPIDGHRGKGMQGQIVVGGGGASKPGSSGGATTPSRSGYGGY